MCDGLALLRPFHVVVVVVVATVNPRYNELIETEASARYKADFVIWRTIYYDSKIYIYTSQIANFIPGKSSIYLSAADLQVSLTL